MDSTPFHLHEFNTDIQTISPQELHLGILKAYRLGNQCRHVVVMGLVVLDETEGILKALEYASIFEYAQQNFRFKRTQTYEALRVGRKLLGLPKLTGTFREGKIDWSSVIEISRVATGETEEEWIAFAAEKTVRQIQSEVQSAQEKGRDRPRKDGCSMPNRKMRLPLEFTREEYEVLTKALGQLGQELVERHGEEKKPDPKSLLLLLARLFLESEPETGLPKGRKPKEDPRFHILYQCCKDCGKAHLVTEEGLVDVPREHVERLEGSAQVVEIRPEEELPGADPTHRTIDRPNTPEIMSKVYHRDGMKCAVPFCPHRFHPHCHHIVRRADGGRTELYNEVLLCPFHHAMIHDGQLRVERDEAGKLRFVRESDSVWDILDREGKEMSKAPVCVVAPKAEGGNAVFRRLNNDEDPEGRENEAKDLEDQAVRDLVKVGLHREVAQARVRHAIRKLKKEGRPLDQEAVIQGACDAFEVFPGKPGDGPKQTA
jgi:hypothetical protein